MGTSLEGLISLLEGLEVPEREITELFINAVKLTPAAGICSVFFNDDAECCDFPTWFDDHHAATVADIAIPLMAWNVGQIAHFADTIDTERAEETWTSILDGQRGKEMSRAILFHWLMQKSELTPYLTDKDHWATVLAKYLCHLMYRLVTTDCF